MGAPGAEGRRGGASIDVLVVARSTPDVGDVVDALKMLGLEVERAQSPDPIAHSVVAGRPSVVVIDMRLDSDGDGLPDRILSWVCRNTSSSVLVLTDSAQTDARLRALRLGAEGHVVAPFEGREVTARVEHLIARRHRGRSANVEIGDMTIDVELRSATRNGEIVNFTPRELALLLALVQRAGEAVSKHELLETVWRGEARSENVVEANVSALRRKLHAVGPPVIHTVHRSGYLFRPAPTSPAATRASLIEERDRMVRERDAIIARRDEIIHRLRGERDGRP